MNPLVFVLAVLGIATSAHTRYHGVPVLWLIAATLALTTAAIVLVLLRLLVRDCVRLRPKPVTT